MKPIVVQKFGGTSVGSIERIRDVARIVKASSQYQNNVVVVSAMSGTTNRLVEMGSQMSSHPEPQALDMLLASGEQISCALLAMALADMNVASEPLLAFQAGIETDSLFGKARIRRIDEAPLERIIARGKVPIVAGFQGVSQQGGQSLITTLGRGGSDTSAVALAIALKATRCDIFTDVDGVYTTDPRIVPEARRLDRISFEEMMELASLGAKVLHMRCVELAAKYKMPLRVLSTFDPEGNGTTLMDTTEDLESPAVSSITADSAESLLTVKVPEDLAKYPARFFKPLASAGINVDVIVKSPPDESGNSTLSFTVPRLDCDRAKSLLSKFALKVQRESVVKVSIVGIGMRTHSGVAAKMFETLEAAQIPVELITTSEIKVSVLLDEAHKNEAIRQLHKAFDLGSK